jgi:hypothetical protein
MDKTPFKEVMDEVQHDKPVTRVIAIRGYFCITKEYPPLDAWVLNKTIFKESIRRLDVGNLEILPEYECVWGNRCFNLELIAVVDTTGGSLIPFFIDEKKSEKLQDLIKVSKPTAIVDL